MKEQWKDFFVPVIGEIMFQPRAEQSQNEVDEIIKCGHILNPLALT